MQTAAILFVLAALGGLTMVIMRLRGIPQPPTWLALIHGTVAAAGLITLGYNAMTQTLPTLAMVALGIFVLAALGGFTIFGLFHMQGKPLPIPLILGHGLTALVGVGLLIAAMMQVG